MTINKKIEECLAAKKFLTWSQGAQEVLGTSTFKPSDLGKISKAFDEAVPGASALLVDRGGRYSYRAPVVQHAGWLKAHGYTSVPEVKEKVEKSGVALLGEPVPGVTQAPKASQDIEDLKAQIAELTKLLTGGKKRGKKTA